MTIRQLKRGDWFTKKPLEYPNENQVWVRGEYDRSARRYLVYKWADVNYSQYLKGDQVVFCDFCF